MRDVPKLYKGIYKRAMESNSKAAAIKAFCLECVHYQRNEITDCTDVDCPLFKHRPYQDKSTDFSPQKGI